MTRAPTRAARTHGVALPRRIIGRGVIGAIALAVGGCTVGPDYATPEVVTPETFGRLEEQSGTSRAVAGPADLSLWWTRLSDPTLDSLVRRAIGTNLDLRVAEARVREARALRGVAAADLWPTIDAAAAYSRSRGSENVIVGQLNSQRGSGVDLYQVGFDAAWEIDVFGGVRRSIEAAEADEQAAEETRRDVLVSLISEVARNYVELRAFQRRGDIARRNVEIARESLALSTSRFEAGLTGELDVAQARAQLESRLAAVPPLDTGLAQAVHRLGVLLGLEPVSLRDELAGAAPIPVPPAEVPVGLPSELLRRRPDVRRAERQLAAATARIGVATADLFPRFSITGYFNLESNQFGTLGDMDSRAWSIGPAMRWNVFDAGRIRSNINAQDARTEAALALYQKAVLTSLEDTENALVSFSQEQGRRDSLERAVAANTRAVDLANQLYSSGLRDFLNVLTSQLALFESQDQLAQSDLAVTESLIALYKALGGGWEAPQEARADSSPQ